ncbi:MAG: hypothetical protein J7577_13470 [Sphingobacteriaceae bacterium]|nr:hypothetical protein [Sphingobacteriaceae bacterium]
MKLKKKIIALIEKSGFENKEVLALLDDIRKNYHNRKNLGDKGLSEKELSKMVAIIRGKEYPLSKDKCYLYYRGGWRKVYGDLKSRHIVYLRSSIEFKVKKKE